MWLKLRRTLLLAFTALLIISLYFFLHEAGHALAGLLFGGTLLNFDANPFSLGAHALISGRFSPVQRSLIYLAGPALPLLLWAAFMLAVPRRANPLLETVKAISTLGVLNAILPWVILPALYVQGLAPARDDVTGFLAYSGVSPWLAMGTAFVVYLAGWALFLRRIRGLGEELAFLAESGDRLFSPSSQQTLRAMIVTAATMVCLLVSLSVYLGR